MTTSLDDMIDRAPDGEIEVAGGTFKHAYDGNWKVYFENLCDAAHPLFTHRSSIEAAQAAVRRRAFRRLGRDRDPPDAAERRALLFWETQVGIWTYPNGHSYLGDYHDDSKLVAALKDPVFREYIAALEKKKGKAETKRILEVRRWNSNIYPNVSLMSQFQQLRVVHPIAVNRTVVHTYNFRLKGAPEQMFRNTISFANIVNGTGSLVLTDDLEIYNRIDIGLSSEGAEWLQIGRGYQSDVPDAHGGRRGVNSTSEVYIRNMLDAWLGYMNQSRAATRRAPQADDGEAAEAPTRIATRQRRRVAAPRGRLPAKPAGTLDLAPLRAVPAARGAAARRGEVRRLARAVHRRRLVLGAERAEPGQSARHGVADLRRPAAAGDAGAPAREPAHVFAGAALAQPAASSATSRSRTPRAAPPRCARNS